MIYIVSGLPRSGTSMMMQMFAAAGISILTDELRKADVSNPQGYYEYEPVKKMAADNSWLPQAEGKCVKIIAQLLPYLKKGHAYKIVFMDRKLDEVLKSQQVMLGKGDQPANPILAETFKKQVATILQTIQADPEKELLVIDHRDAISNPLAVAQKVKDFLGLDIDHNAMAAAVNPDLHRNKM